MAIHRDSEGISNSHHVGIPSSSTTLYCACANARLLFFGRELLSKRKVSFFTIPDIHKSQLSTLELLSVYSPIFSSTRGEIKHFLTTPQPETVQSWLLHPLLSFSSKNCWKFYLWVDEMLFHMEMTDGGSLSEKLVTLVLCTLCTDGNVTVTFYESIPPQQCPVTGRRRSWWSARACYLIVNSVNDNAM